MRHKFGFTLAETLLTLTIIGVVSAITLPSVVGNYEKKVVGVKLHKFYSQMNLALAQYLKDNHMVPQDMTSPTAQTTAATKNWWTDTIGPSFSDAREFTSTLSDSNQKYCVALKDETAFCIKRDTNDTNNTNIQFYTEAKYADKAPYDGKHGYLFVISKGKLYASVPTIDTTLPTRALLLDSCKKCNYSNSGNTNPGKCHACSRLIQIDGWELKNDYPWKKECVGSSCN